MLTRDVDVMINRADLERVKEAAASEGFRFRHSAGWDMLLYGESTSAGNAMHLLFSGERVRPAQVMPNPSIAPESKPLLGRDVMVIPAADLLRMKLSSFRLKDQVHVQVMDAAGLIPPEAAEALPVELRKHLEYIRMQE